MRLIPGRQMVSEMEIGRPAKACPARRCFASVGLVKSGNAGNRVACGHRCELISGQNELRPCASTNSFLDEIRDRVPISAVIGSACRGTGRDQCAAGRLLGLLSVHGEKSPSFHCEDKKGRYHCFGCGVSGDHFRFLTELDGLGFPEAVERIAEMAGVPMPARDAEAEQARAGTRQPARRDGNGDAALPAAIAVGRPAPRRVPICATAG